VNHTGGLTATDDAKYSDGIRNVLVREIIHVVQYFVKATDNRGGPQHLQPFVVDAAAVD
jgi:hypothetical protein